MAKKRDNKGDFLRNFLGGSGNVDPDKLSKHVIRHDKWDSEDYANLLEEMRELAAAEDRLTDVVETGGSAFADAFFGLVKARVDLENPKEVRPSHLINRFVMGEAVELKEYDEMRTYCVSPDAQILTADLRWIPARDALKDMPLLAFDEFPVHGYGRRWRRSVVESVREITRPCYDLTFDDGTRLRCSAEHQWLILKNGVATWRTTEQLRAHPAGTRIVRVLDTWTTDTSWEAGYLAAAFDGEGCLGQTTHINPRSLGGGTGTWTKTELAFAQKPNAMLEEVQRALKELGFEFSVYGPSPQGVCHLKLGQGRGSRAQVLRFLGTVRPFRLLENMTADLGTMNILRGTKLVKKEFVGDQSVMAIGTSTGTIVVEGLASHNSVGDPIGAALGTVAMEPELEILFDKLKEQQKLADQLQQQMQQMQQLQQEQHDLDQMMQQAQQETGELDEGQAQNFQEQQSLIQQAMEQLQQQIEQGASELAEQLGVQQGTIQGMLKAAFKEAIKDAEQMEASAQAWGLEPGVLQRMDAKERIEMAKRLNTDKFKRIAQIFGPMHRMAFAEQQRKTIHSRDEVFNVEIGNDIARLLPMELMKLIHPLMKLEFYRKYYEGELLQYELRGTEKLAKGGIVFCEDGSGSMAGEPEIWAKAVGLSLLQIAKSQNRSFYGIHFGSPGQIKQFDFRDPKKITLEGVIDFAEIFFNGGTDFMTPLSRALDLMKEEHAAKGAVKGDIILCTDGMCGVNQQWLDEFKAEQNRIGFRVYGIIIGGHPDSEPLKTISDGRVLTVQNLIRGDEIREIFRSV